MASTLEDWILRRRRGSGGAGCGVGCKSARGQGRPETGPPTERTGAGEPQVQARTPETEGEVPGFGGPTGVPPRRGSPDHTRPEPDPGVRSGTVPLSDLVWWVTQWRHGRNEVVSSLVVRGVGSLTQTTSEVCHHPSGRPVCRQPGVSFFRPLPSRVEGWGACRSLRGPRRVPRPGVTGGRRLRLRPVVVVVELKAVVTSGSYTNVQHRQPPFVSWRVTFWF